MKRTLSIPAVVLVAVVALVLGTFGSATAASLTKGQVKKIAAKVVDKKASSLTVAKAATATKADSATTATTAASASTAKVADGLSPLPSGQTMSGVFGFSGIDGGYGSQGITYPRPLSTPIANSRIIDTSASPDPVHCPGAGKAAAGYLCLYFEWRTGQSGDVYGYSTTGPAAALPNSVGFTLYGVPNNTTNWASGIYTVGAP